MARFFKSNQLRPCIWSESHIKVLITIREIMGNKLNVHLLPLPKRRELLEKVNQRILRMPHCLSSLKIYTTDDLFLFIALPSIADNFFCDFRKFASKICWILALIQKGWSGTGAPHWLNFFWRIPFLLYFQFILPISSTSCFRCALLSMFMKKLRYVVSEWRKLYQSCGRRLAGLPS